MRKPWWILAALLASLPSVQADDNVHRIGAGANYWVALEDLDEDFDENGFSYFISYQFRPGWAGLEFAGEMLPDRFGEDAYAPEAYLIIGKIIYAAAGIGWIYSGSEWADDPFVALKAGLELPLFDRLFLDVNASYRFDSDAALDDAFEDIDTDTVFLGGAVRFGF